MATRINRFLTESDAQKTSASGTGWTVTQKHGIVSLALSNLPPSGATLPAEFRPTKAVVFPVVDLTGQSPTARVIVNPEGAVTTYSVTGGAYGTCTYIT